MFERSAGSLRVPKLLLQTAEDQVVRFRVVDLVPGPLCTRVYAQERHPRSQLCENIMRVLGDIRTGFGPNYVAGFHDGRRDVDIDELMRVYASSPPIPGLRYSLWGVRRVGRRRRW